MHEAVYDSFVSQLVRRASTSYRLSTRSIPSARWSPRSSTKPARREDRALGQRSLGPRSRTLAGGKREGTRIPPTVLRIGGADQLALKVVAEEVFGPVLAVQRYSRWEDAIAQAGATRYGLQAAVFTRIWPGTPSLRRAAVGAPSSNDSPSFRVDAMPYGGVRDSGLGREGYRLPWGGDDRAKAPGDSGLGLSRAATDRRAVDGRHSAHAPDRRHHRRKVSASRPLGVRQGAEMWEAEHQVVGRKVTLKLVTLEVNSDVVARRRLVCEARAAAEIGHASVVEIYDVGVTPEGVAYLVTEPLRGETLADVVARHGAMQPEDACHVMLQVLAGLEAAHAANIVHGDLRSRASSCAAGKMVSWS